MIYCVRPFRVVNCDNCDRQQNVFSLTFSPPHTIANPVVHAVFQTALIVFIGYSLFTQVAFNGRLCFANHFVCTARNYHRCRFRFSNVAVLSRPGRWKGEALNELVLEIFIGQLNVSF